MKSAFSSELRAYHSAFHPVWGQMFKVGYQNSRFAQQVPPARASRARTKGPKSDARGARSTMAPPG